MAGMSQQESQAFWNEFMRRPEAKEAYQADLKLQMRRSDWRREKEAIEEGANQRRILADALEAAPADIKKLIAPIFHIRIVEKFLWLLFDECEQSKKKNALIHVSFMDKLRDERTLDHLQKLRQQFQDGGEERMESVENQWYSIMNNIVEDEESKKENKPINVDVHTLKHILEFGQECKREGNNKFREGLYEEALHIYTQGDDMFKKYTVAKHLKNELKWFTEYHLACLKNKAQAALKLELFSTALDAADAALRLDAEDHKAWYRKVQAEKSLGKFDEAEASLSRLEDVARWCPDRRNILKDCEAERKRIHAARLKHKAGTKEMLGKAFKAGIFSVDREKNTQLEEEAEKWRASTAAQQEEERAKKPIGAIKPLERNVTLTAVLAGDLIDELAGAYGHSSFQYRVKKCARDSNYDKGLFLTRLKTIALEVQKPIIERWGFEGSEHGVREMTVAIRDLAGKNGTSMPDWLKAKQDKCLELLYGGHDEGGMAPLLMSKADDAA